MTQMTRASSSRSLVTSIYNKFLHCSSLFGNISDSIKSCTHVHRETHSINSMLQKTGTGWSCRPVWSWSHTGSQLQSVD